MKKLLLIIPVISILLTTVSCSSGAQEEEPNTSGECEVVFQDFDGSVLKSETIPAGDSAKPPVGLKRDGYKFVKWDTSFDEVTEDVVVKAVYEEITEPTLIVDTVYAQGGGEDVVVKVHVTKNPGFLTMLLNTIYVENAMQLTKIESGSTMDGYTLIEPKTLGNACNIAWYSTDVPETITDGEVALLHFKLSEGVADGAYEISVTCDHNAFDANYQEIPFDSIKGYVIIDSSVVNEEGAK